MPQGQCCTAACIHCNGRAAPRLRKKDTMKPDLENSRSFAMTLAHRAVRDVRRDGFRQLRNYVDMCALLAQRPDLKRFFDAQGAEYPVWQALERECGKYLGKQ